MRPCNAVFSGRCHYRELGMRDTITGAATGGIVGWVLAVPFLKLATPSQYNIIIGVAIIGTIVGATQAIIKVILATASTHHD